MLTFAICLLFADASAAAATSLNATRPGASKEMDRSLLFAPRRGSSEVGAGACSAAYTRAQTALALYSSRRNAWAGLCKPYGYALSSPRVRMRDLSMLGESSSAYMHCSALA